MRIIENLTGLKDKKRAIALGNFDGLHIGHQKVIKEAIQHDDSLCPTVLHFHPHPLTYNRGVTVEALMPRDLFLRELAEQGVEEVICLDFGRIVNQSPREFVEEFLLQRLNAAFLSCGYNYSFGKNAVGNTDTLGVLCRELEIPLSVTKEIDFQGEAVSSTRIRNCIMAGDVSSAAEMLGRPFSFQFEVVDGDRRGRLLGAPTINQNFPEQFVHPKFGVYASRTYVDGMWKPSVTNFGIRPTVALPVPRSETCILDYRGNLYGQYVEVSLLEFIRGEQKFSSLQELAAQIAKDAKTARKIFETNRWAHD